MKLSDLSTDRALDALCELTPYISSICEDRDLVTILGEKMDVQEGMNLYGQFAMLAGRIGSVAPILLKTHRADVYGILSIVNERKPEEIAAQPVVDTIRQMREVFQDSDLLHFFKSFARRELSEFSVPSAPSPACE